MAKVNAVAVGTVRAAVEWVGLAVSATVPLAAASLMLLSQLDGRAESVKATVVAELVHCFHALVYIFEEARLGGIPGLKIQTWDTHSPRTDRCRVE
jgi:hypothetical protein